MSKSKASENRKKILLAALGALFAVVLIYQLFLGGPAPRKTKSANSNAAVATTSSTSDQGAQKAKPRPSNTEQDQLLEVTLNDLTPLNLSALHPAGGPTAPGERGPIFAYWVKPPDPPPPPIPPPPIGLQSVQPASAVAGTPRNITLTITGSKIPADAVIYFDGTARQTKRVSDTQLSTELLANEYASARSINIEVKSQSDPVNNNSNPIQFTAQPLPEPGFRYIGRLGEFGVFELTASKEIKRLPRGEKIQNVWRIDSISDTGVEVTHVQYEIKKRVPMQEKSK
ncbi:MAG TPA: IPT/TIG domain-containing protein [Blastocatellia bacterium]|nr:IPT/TIG domain-containing protein [Blastocatellia bacterium]